MLSVGSRHEKVLTRKGEIKAWLYQFQLLSSLDRLNT